MATIAVAAAHGAGRTVHFTTDSPDPTLRWSLEPGPAELVLGSDMTWQFPVDGTYDCACEATNGDTGAVTVTVPASGGGGAGGVLPLITSVNPVSGPQAGGTAVTITGSGFTGVDRVYFGLNLPSDNLVVVDDTTITVTTRAGPYGQAHVIAARAGEPVGGCLVNGYAFI